MSGRDEERLKGGIKGDTTRQARLEAALRENLRRRKARARGQGGTTEDTAQARPDRDGDTDAG